MLTVDPYDDARLVALYDQENSGGPDHDFYRELASGLSARRIVDLGCGTGLLTRTLVQPGRVVVGVDPSPAMLNAARSRPETGQVTWILGDAGDVPGHDADLALMTGNVAQVFVDDAQWARTLAGLHRALRGGGTLAFESRNPDARVWRTWTRSGRLRRIETANGPLTRWVDNAQERDGVVTYNAHYIFESTDEHLVSHGTLRFRSAAEISDDLQRHGFDLQDLYGDWQQGQITSTSPIMVFIARAVE